MNTVKTVNSFFKNAILSDVSVLKEKIVLSERQSEIFERFYIKKQDVNFIADSIGFSSRVVTRELGVIRNKIIRIIPLS